MGVVAPGKKKRILQKFLSWWNKEYHGPVISTLSTYSEDPVFKLEGRCYVLRLFIVFSSLFRQMSEWCTHLVTVSFCHAISTSLFLLLLDAMQFEIPKSSCSVYPSRQNGVSQSVWLLCHET